MKKALSMLMVTIMMLTVLAVPAFADDGCTTYPNITLANSDDFTIVEQNLYSFRAITLQGLDSSWTKHDFTATEDDYITWTSSNPSNVMFYDGSNFSASISGTVSPTFLVLADGTATITATYDTPDDAPVTVTSYIVAEDLVTTSSVSGIDIEIVGENTDSFTMNDATVPLFDLSDKGICSDDDDVLKRTPSTLHALLYALEVHYSDETTSTPIENFDWNWVKDNCTIDSEGSYVVKINDDTNDYSKGWQFELNGNSLDHASSVTPLSPNQNVTWEFKAFSW